MNFKCGVISPDQSGLVIREIKGQGLDHLNPPLRKPLNY
jgi:hypothetical protein